ncbi:MAG: DUF3857 domain-containing protein [Bacteroidales bacterium]|nr:DUF3857 domain-containing protein [Bacteroidales bacterium]MBN2821149.1 DUF3857 domain-containing protein [Bacteroidales bacterium]
MKSRFLILFLIFLFCNIYTIAQKLPIKFGDVSKEEIEMRFCEYDSSAPAAVLYDYGGLYVTDGRFTKIIRIKIFKKEGLHLANQVYPSNMLTQIRGKTYNLENDEIIVDKLENESIFKERIFEDNYNYRVTMPNVKVGSVIEIEYKFPGLPAIWYFQRDIPVLKSELYVPKTPNVEYRKNYYGYFPLSVVVQIFINHLSFVKNLHQLSIILLH